MNNIEILEEKIKIIESLCTDDCINKSTVIQPLKYAIENLIQENKELKDKIKDYEKQLDLDYVENNYIPKSKVKEKIEVLKMKADYDWIYKYDYKDVIKILQEFLEGE